MSDPESAALLAEIARSRQRLADARRELRSAGEGLRRKLDVPSRITDSFRKHRPAWLGGAALLGFLLSRLPARQKTVYVDESTGRRLGIAGRIGTLWTLAKFAASVAKPFLGNLAGTKIADLARHFTKRKPEGPPADADDE